MQKRNKFEVDYIPSKWPFFASQGLNASVILLASISHISWQWMCVLLLFSILFALQAWKSLRHSSVEQISCVDGLWYLKLKQQTQRKQAQLAQVKTIGPEILLLAFKVSEEKLPLQRVYFAKDNIKVEEIRALKRIIFAT